MNDMDPLRQELDAQLRRLLGRLDTRAGFEARVTQRVVALRATTVASRADLRAQFERRRDRVRRRLRREAWMNGITILGLAACAGALLWRFAPEIQRLATSATWPVDPGIFAVGTLGALGVVVWIVMKRMNVAIK
jgi:hypothetical protein